MKRLPLILALSAAPVLALAQAPPTHPPGVPPPPRPQMFLSPSGEPFRLVPGAGEPFNAWFTRVDANHDGRIDRAEFRADAQAFFKLVDASGDDVIDGFEVSAYEHKIVPELIREVEFRVFGPPEGSEPPEEGGAHRGGHGPAGGRRPDHPDGERPDNGSRGHTSLLGEPEPVSGADSNMDGKVTAAEWLQNADRRFDLLDDQHLGYLTREALFAKLPKPPVPKKKR
ncbi:MAG TPA: EF-hand domain-containing protein [Caulobacteraceae bacterium]